MHTIGSARGRPLFGEYVVHTRILSNKEVSPQGIRERCLPTRQYFDADKLTGNLHVRSRQPGDRMMPLGMNHTRKVQGHHGGPPHSRISAGCNSPDIYGDEEILWIAGYTRSCLASVDNRTKTLLELELSLQK